MNRKIIWGLLVPFLLIVTSCAQTQAPAPFGPVPTENQLRWHEMEYYAFLHFSMNTFTDQEWGYGDEDLKLFDPPNLDCRQWARVCKEAGMKGIIMVVKHHCGFCLWPSKYTGFSVKNTPWKNGKDDVVRELAVACKEYGLKLGIYLSPWDRNNPDYGKPEYITYFRNQLTELLTSYGPIFEVWFDGANGGDGYYGGARETRKIDNKTYYDWQNTWQIVREIQPNAVMFSDAGPDIRWVGNERGIGSLTNWCLLNRDQLYPGGDFAGILGAGHEDGKYWVPAEVDVSIRKGWFYHKSQDSLVRSPQNLLDLYYSSVGRNCNLLLNIPPDRRGLIHENDVKSLMGFRELLAKEFESDIAIGKKITVSDKRGNDYDGEKVNDANPDTYWATKDSQKSGDLIIDLVKETEVNRIVIQEYIKLGQRVQEFKVEALENDSWVPVIDGTTIGYKVIRKFPVVKTNKIKVIISKSKACPVISNIELYRAPGE
jgi:alpha-L-fucosidase